MKNLRSLFLNVFGRKQYMLAQINPTELILARIQRKGKSHRCSHIIREPLSNLEIQQNRIFNPTYLVGLLTKFVKQQQLCKPRIIVSAPLLQEHDSFALLQTALCMSKENFVIDFLTTTPIIEPTAVYQNTYTVKNIFSSKNLLADWLIAGYHATTPLLMVVGIALSIFCIVTTLSYQSWQQFMQRATDQQNHLNQSLVKLKNNIKELHAINQQKNALASALTRFDKHIAIQNNPHIVLNALAETIPQHSKLSELMLGNAPGDTKQPQPAATAKPKTIPLDIKGVTLKPEEVGMWTKSLSEHLRLSQCSLTRLKKMHLTKPTSMHALPRYSFIIKGDLGL